jgi:hypothetical protein
MLMFAGTGVTEAGSSFGSAKRPSLLRCLYAMTESMKSLNLGIGSRSLARTLTLGILLARELEFVYASRVVQLPGERDRRVRIDYLTPVDISTTPRTN